MSGARHIIEMLISDFLETFKHLLLNMKWRRSKDRRRNKSKDVYKYFSLNLTKEKWFNNSSNDLSIKN